MKCVLWLVVLAVLSAGLAGTITGIYLTANNTIDNNGQWLSSKQQLALCPMGAYPYTRQTQAIARGYLDLGAWFGYQELLLKTKLYFVRQIDFDFMPGFDFNLILTKDDEQFTGIRIGSSPAVESFCFVATSDGEFVSKQKLELTDLTKNSWSHLTLGIQDNVPSLTIGGAPVALGDLKLSEPYTIGFRGLAMPALIDNLVILRGEGLNPITESFFSVAEWRKIFRVSLLAVLFAMMCIVCAMSTAAIPWRRIWAAAAIMEILGILAIGTVGLYLYYYYSRTFPTVSSQALAEQVFLENNYAARRAEIRSRYAPFPPSDVRRILFVGSSQTFGIGAAKQADTMVNKVEQRLSQLGGGRKFQCINTGLVGATAMSLLEVFQQDWLDLHPQLVVVNLCNNDCLCMDSFEANLEKFVAVCRERGIPLAFILEAVDQPGGLATHPIMRRVADKHKVPLIDLHGFLQEHQDEGFLWWDKVHLTSFGQRLAGNHVAETLLHLGSLD